jgi:hypothetical protein
MSKIFYCFLFFAFIFTFTSYAQQDEILARFRELEQTVKLLQAKVELLENKVKTLEDQIQKTNLLPNPTASSKPTTEPSIEILSPESGEKVDVKNVLKGKVNNAKGLYPVIAVKPLMVGRYWIQASVTEPNSTIGAFQSLLYIGESSRGKGEDFEISVFLVTQENRKLFKKGLEFTELPLEKIVAITSVVVTRK